MDTLAIKRGIAGLLLLSLLQACSTTPRVTKDGIVTNGVAVLGVVNRPDVKGSLSSSAMSALMLDVVQERGKFSPFSAAKVDEVIGATTYGGMMRSYAKTGALRSEDIQILMAARLPVNYALVARIEENSAEPGEAVIEPTRSKAGVLESELVTQSTLRRVIVSAAMIDLRTGQVYWNSAYQAEPVNTVTYTRYSGKSFTGSLAATMANTVANGVGLSAGPPPLSMKKTLQSLFQEVAGNMKTNKVMQ